MPGIGTAIGALVGGVGGYLSASGTQSAQNQANQQAAQQAAMQSAQAFANYLSSRGISLQQVAAANPQLEAEFNRIKAAGERRDFQTWLYDHLRNNPSDPVWTQINSGRVGAQNTTLPTWAVDANGNPLQPALLEDLVGIYSGANNPATAPIGSLATLTNARGLLAANPDLAAQVAAAVEGDGRTPEQWLVDHITQTEAQSGGGTFTDALRNFAVGQATAGTGTGGPAAGPAGTGNNATLDPAIAALIPRATDTLGSVFDGRLLDETLTALAPVQAARTSEANAIAARVNELRGLSGNLLNTELEGIGGVLNARRTGAEGIFTAATDGARGIDSAAREGLGNLLNVRTTGARNIYDAELLRADTYNQAARQALTRMLAEQGAERARRGFTGGSSGSDIVRARLNADYIQRGAAPRADAGVNYQTRLGSANEQDGLGRLQTAVELARALGLAGTNRATSFAGAGEQDAIARLTARAADATRRLGYLTADGDIAAARADLANAQDALSAITNNQNRRVGAIGAPYSLAGSDLSLKDAISNQQYGGLDAILRRLGSFSTSPASGPALTTSTPGAVMNNSQISGGALTGIGSAIGSASSSGDLQRIIDMFRNSGAANSSGAAAGGGAPRENAGGSGGYNLLSSPSFLGGRSVFGGG